MNDSTPSNLPDEIKVLDFTLENLVGLIHSEGYTLISSGPDIHDHLAYLRKLSDFEDKLLAPAFYATVKIDSDRLQGTADLMELVWKAFGRGKMEFIGFEDGVNFVVRISQLPSMI